MHHNAINPSAERSIEARRRLRMQQGADHLHRLGARGILEFLAELAEDTATAPVILAKLAAWSALDAATVRSVLDHYSSGRSFRPALSQVPA